MSVRRALPEVVLFVEEVEALFARAIAAEDLDRAAELAELLLIQNDGEEDV